MGPSNPKNALRTKALFFEREPDVIKQDRLRQNCSENSSWKPQKAIGTLSGGAIGEPGRFAAA
eukprot:2454104-Pyramimonas_sp.AAC.1